MLLHKLNKKQPLVHCLQVVCLTCIKVVSHEVQQLQICTWWRVCKWWAMCNCWALCRWAVWGYIYIPQLYRQLPWARIWQECHDQLVKGFWTPTCIILDIPGGSWCWNCVNTVVHQVCRHLLTVHVKRQLQNINRSGDWCTKALSWRVLQSCRQNAS